MSQTKAQEAFAKGYTKFLVNGEVYQDYDIANAKCEELLDWSVQEVGFYGYHYIRGWEGIYVRTASIHNMNVTQIDAFGIEKIVFIGGEPKE